MTLCKTQSNFPLDIELFDEPCADCDERYKCSDSPFYLKEEKVKQT